MAARPIPTGGGGDAAAGVSLEDEWAAGAVDEVNVTFCPRVFGGATAPTLVDGAGFPRDRILDAKLMHCERIGDELFLRYRIQRSAAKAR